MAKQRRDPHVLRESGRIWKNVVKHTMRLSNYLDEIKQLIGWSLQD